MTSVRRLKIIQARFDGGLDSCGRAGKWLNSGDHKKEATESAHRLQVGRQKINQEFW